MFNFSGFSVAQADLLLKDPLQFRKDFLLWALDRGISWKDPIILQRILASGLKPDNLQPAGTNSIIGNLIFGHDQIKGKLWQKIQQIFDIHFLFNDEYTIN